MQMCGHISKKRLPLKKAPPKTPAHEKPKVGPAESSLWDLAHAGVVEDWTLPIPSSSMIDSSVFVSPCCHALSVSSVSSFFRNSSF